MATTQNPLREHPSREERAKIISTIKKLVSRRHINVSNPNQDYGSWVALVGEQMPRLLEVDRDAFEAGVGDLLSALGSSHTVFYHQRRDSVPAPYSINATLPVARRHGATSNNR